MVIRLVCLLLSLCWSSPLWAGIITPGHVNLQLAPGIPLSDEVQDIWSKLCPAIGEKILLQRGIWGHGSFASFSCYGDGKIFAGKKEKTFTAWRLQFAIGTKDSHINIQFWDQKQFNTIQRMPLGSGLKSLTQPDVAALIALDITLHLPFARMVDGQKASQTAQNSPASLTIPPPETYKVFQLNYENGKWLPNEVGVLQRDPSTSPLSPQWNWIRNDSTGKGGLYWAYPEKRQEIAAALNKVIATITQPDEEEETLLDTLARGYVGVRYGVSIKNDDPLLKESRLVNIFTEVRGGPLAGLRWYWDFVPLTQSVYQGKDINFAFSRPSFGWSVGWDMNFLGLTRFDVTPKFGLSDFRSELPVSNAGTSGSAPVLSFEVKTPRVLASNSVWKPPRHGCYSVFGVRRIFPRRSALMALNRFHHCGAASMRIGRCINAATNILYHS